VALRVEQVGNLHEKGPRFDRLEPLHA
jgi:hypothetical protein